MSLDRSRPYGTVYGGAGHTYEQDGQWFDHEGEPVQMDDPKADDQPKKGAKVTKAKADEPKPDDQLSAQMSE